MKTQFIKTQEDAVKIAEEIAKEHGNAYTTKSSTQCDCGESFCIRVSDSDTLDQIAKIVECEVCFNQYE